VRESGLPVDDATLECVADAVMDPASPPPWHPFTTEERTDDLHSHRWDAVQGYLADHPEIDVDVEVRSRDGRQRLVVGIVGDPGPHRAPLARIAGSRMIVERRPPRPAHTAAELGAIAERVSADMPELAPAGLHVAWLDRWRCRTPSAISAWRHSAIQRAT
jgi:hypothetical protein